MPRRKEFGLFHISINGDLTLVMKGSIGEINRYAKDKGWTFRRDKSNLFGGYWVDDQTGDSYGADIIVGRRGQARNPADDDTGGPDGGPIEVWAMHRVKDVERMKKLAEDAASDLELTNPDDVYEILIQCEDDFPELADAHYDQFLDLAYKVAYHSDIDVPYNKKNPTTDDEDWDLGQTELSPAERFALKVIGTVGRGLPRGTERFDMNNAGFGADIVSFKAINRGRRIKYVGITPADMDDPKCKTFQVTGYDARLQLLGYPKTIRTSSANDAANYLSTIYAIRHAPGARR